MGDLLVRGDPCLYILSVFDLSVGSSSVAHPLDLLTSTSLGTAAEAEVAWRHMALGRRRAGPGGEAGRAPAGGMPRCGPLGEAVRELPKPGSTYPYLAF